MPVHWYYNTAALRQDYGVVKDYFAPKNPHPDSILWRSKIMDAQSILGDQAKFYGMRGAHYHQILSKGDNTLNLQVARVFLRSVVGAGSYDPDAFLKDYKDYMLETPNKDTYAEVYHREFFTNVARGLPLRKCAGPEGHDTASVGGLVAIAPLALYLAGGRVAAPNSERLVSTHLALTHRSARLDAVARTFARLVHSLVGGADPVAAVREAARAVGEERIGGLTSREPGDVVGGLYSTACYIEHSYPSLLFLALKNLGDPENGLEAALVQNANVGGDNCHRGAVLGMIMGAAFGIRAIPQRWIAGLARRAEIEKEIDAFVKAALAGAPVAPGV
eukprot:tig00000889_g5330.t1